MAKTLRWFTHEDVRDGTVCVYQDNLHTSDIVARVFRTAGDDTDERDANARLIAAAPELLDAIKQLTDTAPEACDCIDAAIPNHCPWCLCRAAIAKAEGRANG